VGLSLFTASRLLPQPLPPTAILYSDNEVAGVLKTENRTPTRYFRTLIEEFSSEPKQKRESRKIELPTVMLFCGANLFQKVVGEKA